MSDRNNETESVGTKSFAECVAEALSNQIMNEGRDIAKFMGGTPNSNNIQLTEYSLGTGRGLQVTTGMKNAIQLDKSGAERVGKLLVKWAQTQ